MSCLFTSCNNNNIIDADLDAATTAVIEKGKRNVEILKQGQYSPLRVEEQAAIIYCGTYGLLMDVPVDKIKDFGIDILVVVAYGKLLPTWLLNTPKFGCLNVHFSNLPKYRGAAPIQRAIENGEKETGISFMKLTEGLDEGPIYKNIVVNIENKDYYEAESILLKESLNNIW